MWKPNATVAAVIERGGRFLMVAERINGELKLNQPAGHVEFGESIAAACARETREETAYQFTPTAFQGLYQWTVPGTDLTYLRFAFTGELGEHDESLVLGLADEGIEEAVWLTRDELVARADQHRSPLILACVDDYLAGKSYPLAVLQAFDDVQQFDGLVK